MAGMDILLGYEARFLRGMVITAGVALAALALALALGMAGALAKTSGGTAARRVAACYTGAVRGIPELLFILLVYYDLQRLINVVAEWAGGDVWIIPPFWAGAVAIGLFYGAYMTETLRGGILAVGRGQREAAAAPRLAAAGGVFWRDFSANAAACPARHSQQLAGAAQGHGAGVGHRPCRRHDGGGESGKVQNRPAVFVLCGGGGGLSCADDNVGGGV